MRSRRVAALLISALLVLALLLSAAFVLLEQHHECTGEHCAICAAVTNTIAFLKAEASVFLPTAGAFVALCSVVLLAAILQLPDIPGQSPVSLKVKLSD